MLSLSVSPVYFWLVILIVCLVVEAVTTQLLTVWFAAGSIGALIAANMGFSYAVQLGIFLILSFALLLPLRPLMRSTLRPKHNKTNADRILDQTAVVIEPINNKQGSGQIRLLGQVWTARSIREEDHIPEGEVVIVRSISGVKAMVERLETNQGG